MMDILSLLIGFAMGVCAGAAIALIGVIIQNKAHIKHLDMMIAKLETMGSK